MCVTIARDDQEAFTQAAKLSNTAVSCIGEINVGDGIRCINKSGEELVQESEAYLHFKGKPR